MPGDHRLDILQLHIKCLAIPYLKQGDNKINLMPNDR